MEMCILRDCCLIWIEYQILYIEIDRSDFLSEIADFVATVYEQDVRKLSFREVFPIFDVFWRLCGQ